MEKLKDKQKKNTNGKQTLKYPRTGIANELPVSKEKSKHVANL